MRVRGRATLLHAAAAAGWIGLLASVPLEHGWAFELGRLGVAVGPTCTVVLALRKLTLPVAQVFEAGRRVGREESVPQRRHLRVVDD